MTGVQTCALPICKLDKKLLLPPETALLIRQQVVRINVCLFCIDIGRLVTIKTSMNEAKFDALEQYRTSELFTDAERAALDYVTELTRDKKVERTGHFCSSVPLLFRTRDLRDRLACCQRAHFQHDQYQSEPTFGHAV